MCCSTSQCCSSHKTDKFVTSSIRSILLVLKKEITENNKLQLIEGRAAWSHENRYLSESVETTLVRYGYGCSTGKPSENNLYANISTAFETLKKDYNVPADRVILYGQSIGTVPSVDLASRKHVAALILHSPLISGMRVAFPGTQTIWCCDAFQSIEKVPRVKCPTLVIHGTDDEVIDFLHGVSIYERCPASVESLWVLDMLQF
ncbi:unnamed protein product [Caenorhabditis angaria]|uniref:Serine aminopeptidase S33 domain-containing protein n=1 Tax=Caenorhabditis angaria TaxID=860376 RepID=A0A9P1MTY4_9PELO|nr:unnamed protein product [Caenorhabditis angaria]